MTKAAQPAEIYQVKITLKDIRPAIWRRVLIPGDITLAKLHRIIQETMGWYDGHLHQFIVGETHYGVPDPDDFSEVKNEKSVRLGQIVSRPKQRFLYEYDFGDGWEHEIVVEKILNPEPGVRYPLCPGGARACPPEDCGGVPGYADFLEAIRNPEHEEHEEMLEWIGGEFDPEEFDLEAVNQSLKSIR
ncbi:plasmid pRiA4b ORF-3 family protein [bacterium]|nr:MAG: plasmid pRiA4b ORF-3 family protein [bacterium]